MSILEAIILGLVQGATEFLPVSSSGHLILASKIMGMTQISILFELICHMGTLLAIIIVLRKDLLSIVKKPLGSTMRLIIIASIPTVILAAVFNHFFRDWFSGEYLVYAFLVTAILLLIAGFVPQSKKEKITKKDALIIGTFQGLAAVPGISRSGSTMAAGTILGLNRDQSAHFSFLISIPIILGSTIIELIQSGVGGGEGFAIMAAGFAASFVGGFIALTLLFKMLKKCNLDVFAIYLFALSVFLLLNDLLFHLF